MCRVELMMPKWKIDAPGIIWSLLLAMISGDRNPTGINLDSAVEVEVKRF
jgi:hypothetical protein